MEKILLVINPFRPDTAAIGFACRVAAMTNSGLTGLLIENLYSNQPIIAHGETTYFEAVTESRFETEGKMLREKTAQPFTDTCRQFNVACDMIIDKGEPIQKVIAESRYADLLILDPKMSFYEEEDQLPSHFARELMTNAECPVLLAPELFDKVDEIVFCYDGSASSVYAIEQFTYLFPGLTSTKLVLLEVNPEKKEAGREDADKMMEWLNRYYNAITQTQLTGSVKDELFVYLPRKTGKLVVMGAYGRNLLSTFFRKSSADILIRTIDLPLFITHR